MLQVDTDFVFSCLLAYFLKKLKNLQMWCDELTFMRNYVSQCDNFLEAFLTVHRLK